MKKNEILGKIVDSLLSQRKELIYELRELNHNETSYLEKRTTLKVEIERIDNQLNMRVIEMEKNN